MRISAALSLAALLAACAGCSTAERDEAFGAAVTGGVPSRGAAAINKYGCGSCHDIPGISGANGRVGPSLRQMPKLTYVAGVLPNTPENMMRWIQDPKGVDEKTAMPNLGVTPDEATDIAAYIYSLK